MDFVRYLERLSKKVAGLDVVVTSAPIHMTSKGKKYFVYQCTRYVYDPSSQLFRPHQIELGSTHGELASLTNGLTMEEAEERQELIGSNFISVYVPNFFSAMFREFASFFYIYQFSVLWLFYYYNYCKFIVNRRSNIYSYLTIQNRASWCR